MMKDPVCGMEIDGKAAKFKTSYKGKIYYFCSPTCKKKFDGAPEQYAGK